MNPSKSRLLIIDDDPISRTLIREILVQDDYLIFTEGCATNIFKLLNEYKPDVLLLDVIMPLTDGFDVTRQIKQDLFWQHMPVILVTSLDAQADLDAGLEAGADEFLTKPLRAPRLRATVRAMARMKERTDQLIRLTRLREDLAHMVVHDLRNPLSVCMMYTDILQSQFGHLDPPDQQTPGTGFSVGKALRSIKEQQEVLSGQIDDILLMAKTEHDELILDLERRDLADAVRHAAASHRSLAKRQGLNLALELPDSAWEFEFDWKLMSRLLGNLLSNAFKFSPTGGTVTVQLRPSGDDHSCTLAVRDEGLGIPPDAREMIFDRYKVASKSHTKIRGIGLGLAFCKMVADAHGGTVAVHDNQPQGTIFEFTFFRQPPPSLQDPPAATRPQVTAINFDS